MMTYGTGAIMGVPSHDERDFQFALKFGLPIIPVIDRPDGATKSVITQDAVTERFRAALSEAGFEFSEADGVLRVAMSREQVEDYVTLVQAHLKPGHWASVAGGRWLFIFDDGVMPFDSIEADERIRARCKELTPALGDRQSVMEILWDIEYYRDILFHAEHGMMINSGAFTGTPGDVAIKRVTDWLEEQKIGEFSVNYRLRDWLVSRQRYWGAPIPIIYCEKCGVVPVPYEDLPVLLPEDAEFLPTGESPLKYHEDFLNTTCPKCGGLAIRETDTMDTFVCSSWYHYAYLSPYYKEDEPIHADSTPIDPEEIAYWAPVDPGRRRREDVQESW